MVIRLKSQRCAAVLRDCGQSAKWQPVAAGPTGHCQKKTPIGCSVNEAADQRLVQINVAAEVPARTAID